MTKAKSGGNGAHASASATAPPTTALSAHQLAAGERYLCTLCRGVETMSRLQTQAAHKAAAYHAELSRRVAEPLNAAELLAVEADMVRFGVQENMLLWQQLAAASFEMQRQMFASIAAAAEDEEEDPTAILRAFMEAGPAAWMFQRGTGQGH